MDTVKEAEKGVKTQNSREESKEVIEEAFKPFRLGRQPRDYPSLPKERHKDIGVGRSTRGAHSGASNLPVEIALEGEAVVCKY